MTVDSAPPCAEPAAEPAAPEVRRAVPWIEAWVAIAMLAAVVATANLFLFPGRDGVFLPVLCLFVLVLAAAFDAATGRIPNPLTYTAILAGLAINALGLLATALAPRVAGNWLGAVGPTQAALGLLVFGGFGLLSTALAGMGGGDMKNLAAVGAMLGFSRAAEALLCALAIAVVYSVINLLIRGRLNVVVRAAMVQWLNIIYLRDPSPTLRPHTPRTIPLAVPVLLGVLAVHLPLVQQGLAWLRG